MFGKTFLKSFLNRRFGFLLYLKIDYSNLKAVFSSLTHKYTNTAFNSWIPFSIALTLFQDFLLNQTHIARIPFWFLETQGFTINSISGLYNSF